MSFAGFAGGGARTLGRAPPVLIFEVFFFNNEYVLNFVKYFNPRQRKNDLTFPLSPGELLC